MTELSTQDMDTLAISELATDQLHVVIALAHRIWPECYAGVIRDDQIDNILTRIYNTENLRAEIADGHRFWVATLGGETVGFASAYRKDDVVWLKKLYILPSLQGRGIGRALMETTAEAFGPVREQRLVVNNNNQAAMRFYERAGFTRVGEVPVKMGDHDFTDFVYARPLEEEVPA